MTEPKKDLQSVKQTLIDAANVIKDAAPGLKEILLGTIVKVRAELKQLNELNVKNKLAQVQAKTPGQKPVEPTASTPKMGRGSKQ